jgi:uncharacterized protein (DUF433 family)
LFYNFNAMHLKEIMNIDPEVLSGEPVFAGTRIPILAIAILADSGMCLDELLYGYPEVSREQAVAAIELCKKLSNANS